MTALTFDQVSACLVTRGDVDMAPILDTLPYGEIVVWDNSVGPETRDLKTYGRYQAAQFARNDVVYFQDDDCIFRHHAPLLADYQPGVLVANWAHGDTPCGFQDVALVGAGAIVDRNLIELALKLYADHFPIDDDFLYDCDFVFGCVTQHQQIHLPFEIRDAAQNGQRLTDQPWQREAKMRVTNRARWLRDHVIGPSQTDTCSVIR